MKVINLIIILSINFICNIVIANSIAVLNIQLIIDKNNQYIELINQIEISQKSYLDSFKITENELEKKLLEIENSKLILNDNEINNKINIYNQDFADFQILVDEFNLHYQNQIIMNRETILKEIIVLLEKYAIENNIELILDSTSYLIASNSIDITNKISNELNNIDLNLEYKNFEKN